VSGRPSLARAGLIVTAAFLASRLLGWVRMAVIGATFPPGSDLDHFFAAFRLPDLMFQLVAAGALSAALVPIVSGLHAHDQDARAWRVASTVTTLVLAVLLVLAILVAIAAPVLVPAFVSFDEAGEQQTVELTRIMLLSPIFLAAAGVATSILNAHGRFAASAIAPLVYNLVIIAAAVFIAPVLGVAGLAVGVVAGAVAHLAVQIRPLRGTGFRYRPEVDLSDPDARQALVLMGPRAIGLGASQLTFVVATSLASGLATGSVSAFTFAFTAFLIPLGIIGIPIGVVTLPSMSRDLARGEIAGYVSLVTRSLRLILFVMLPITALGMVLRLQGVELLFGYGHFGPASVELTASALLILLLALPSEALIAILARAFYAARDTLTPVFAAILAVAINITFGIVAVTVLGLGLGGIALGIALGSWAEALLLLVVLDRRMPTFLPSDVLRAGAPAAAASLVAGVVALAALGAVQGAAGSDIGKATVVLEIVVAGGLGGLVYLAISLALRIPELTTIVRLMSDALPRPGRP